MYLTTGSKPGQKRPLEVPRLPFSCVLAKSGSNLQLSRYNGKFIFINGKVFEIPATGPTLTTSGLSASTLYYIYASMGPALALEASATAYAVDAGWGHYIKSGDSTRTLVGMARTTGGTAFADSATQRFVRSWFNQPAIQLEGAFTANRTTASTTYAEINSEIRVEFIVWTGDVVDARYSGLLFSDSSAYVVTGLGWDGTVDANRGYAMFGTNGDSVCAPQTKSGLTEGYHYLTVMGRVSAGTGTWQFTDSGATPVPLKGCLGGQIFSSFSGR